MGRPQIEINSDEVYKLAKLHCTTKEMADFFGCSTDTLERRFAAEIAKGRADGRKSLRDLQWAAAKKGNVTMLIWLGKQMLGQSDDPIPPDDESEEYTPPDSMTDDRQ